MSPDLTTKEVEVLKAIEELGGEVNGCDVAEKLGMDPGEVLAILNSLQEARLIYLDPVCREDKVILRWRMGDDGYLYLRSLR